MKIFASCHNHSCFSDAEYSPEHMVELAAAEGHGGIILTDHDTVDGLQEAMDYVNSLREDFANHKMPPSLVAINTNRRKSLTIANVPEIIPGIELSTEYQGKDIHILGLYIDYKNPEFLKLLKAGASLKSAYLAVHHEEIVKDLVEKAAMEAKEKTALSIKTRGQRPLENGMTAKSTALYKTDVSKLSPAQRAEIAKRVAKGEIISF